MIPENIAVKLRQSGLRFVVTGGSGWLGQATLNMLSAALVDEFPTRVTVFGSSERILALGQRGQIRCFGMEALSSLPEEPTIFLHYAFLTKERVSQMATEIFIERNRQIAEIVEAAARRIGAVGVFVPSSGAVYRQDGTLETEPEANPYGYMKLADERRFAALAGDLQCKLVLARVFNIAGPFINKLSSYALGSILMDVFRGGPIVLNATNPVIRSYLHVEDLIALSFHILLDRDAENLPAFDTAGEVELEIGELAARARQVLGREDIPIIRPPVQNGPVNRYVGNPATLRFVAARYGVAPAPMDQQISDTARYLEELARS